MAHIPTLYYAGLKTVQPTGWAVIDTTGPRIAYDTGRHGPAARETACLAALYLDALLAGPAPTITVERGARIPDLLDHCLALAYFRIRWATDELRIGDLVRTADGHTVRVAHIHPDGYQPTQHLAGYAFCIGNGYTSFSGGLCPVRPRPVSTGAAAEPARYWFSHHGQHEAHSSVVTMLPTRVWHDA